MKNILLPWNLSVDGTWMGWDEQVHIFLFKFMCYEQDIMASIFHLSDLGEGAI